MCQKMYAKGTGRCVIIHIESDSGELIMIRKEQLRLYAITDTSWLNGASLIDVVENVLKNGATFLQLREKNATHDEIVAKAKAIKPIARKYGVPFVIDDDVQVALEADADGVHIGQSDTDYMTARSILGDNKIIGMTAKTVEQAKEAERLGADYIGTGAVFGSSTKKDAVYMPRERLIEVAGSVNIPVVAIGGIDYDNCGELTGTGIDGIAVVSAIFAADDPGLATKELYLKTGRIFNYHRDFIFDMDGTILDSMPYWRNVSKEYAMQYIDKLPDDFDERTYVMDLDECSAYFRDELGINTDAATMRQTAVDIMTRHYSTEIPAKDGMLELIRREHEAGSCMCIFTSSDRGCVDAALNRLGIADCFNNIFTVYDIPYNKKNPESYKLIAEKMHFKPEDTWVYEDVLHGIESARQGGFKICAVYDEDSKKHWNEICTSADEIRDIRNN